MADIAVIIITHNSQDVLSYCVKALELQSVPHEIIIVDSGSADISYLDTYRIRPGIRVILVENIGFSRANNVGYQAVCQTAEFVLFLNPDAFLTKDTLQAALDILKEDKTIACVGARLLGFDNESGQPTGLLDSTGVFRTWYGRWFDRSQGKKDTGQYAAREDAPALCGAFLFCRQVLLAQLAQRSEDGASVFDPDFFLYKEDIELSLRIKKLGWRIMYHPALKVYHCRGWQKDRENISYQQRLIAAKSEVLLYKKHPSVYILWALLKYGLVRWLKM